MALSPQRTFIRVSAETTGGERLRAHIQAVQSGRVRRRAIDLVADGLRREFLPVLASRVPRVTGRLSKSFRIQNPRDGGSLKLISTAPYANQVRFKQESRSLTRGARTVGELSAQLSREIVPGIALRSIRRALRESL